MVELLALEVFKKPVQMRSEPWFSGDLAGLGQWLDSRRAFSNLFHGMPALPFPPCIHLLSSPARGSPGREELLPSGSASQHFPGVNHTTNSSPWEGEASVSSPRLPSELERSPSGALGLYKGTGAFRNSTRRIKPAMFLLKM